MKKLMMLVVAMWAGCAVAWGGWFNQPANGLSGKTNVVVMTLPNGSKTIETMDDGSMQVTVVTNLTDLYISQTNGNYGGPEAGTEYYLQDVTSTAATWTNAMGDPLTGSVYDGNVLSVYSMTLTQGEPNYTYTGTTQAGVLPITLSGTGGAGGTLTIRWKQGSTVAGYYPMTDGLTTNRTIQAGDVLRFEHGLLKGVE